MCKLILLVVISSLLLVGCKNPFESKDEGVDQLNVIEKRWEDTSKLASSTARISLATPVSQLQDIRRDLNQIEVSECLMPARQALNLYMENQINQFLKFMSDYDSTSFQPDENLIEYFKVKTICTDIQPNFDSGLGAEAEFIKMKLALDKDYREKLEAEAKEKGLTVDALKMQRVTEQTQLEAAAVVAEARGAAEEAAAAAREAEEEAVTAREEEDVAIDVVTDELEVRQE